MVDDEDYRIYAALRSGLDHEAKVMGDRIQWAISFTSGLFAASALLITVIVLGHPDPIATGFVVLAIGGVASIGVAFSFTTWLGVRAAQSQFGYLCQLYFAREETYERKLALPRPFGDRDSHRFGNLSARVFPLMMFACWLLDLAISLTYVFFTFRNAKYPTVWVYIQNLLT